MSKFVLGICIAVGGAWFSGVAAASGQERSDVLQALLDEVRQLRVAIETAAATNGKLQMAVERAGIQEERLWRISREVEALRSEIATASEERMSTEADVKRLEDVLANVTAPEERQAVESRLEAPDESAMSAPVRLVFRSAILRVVLSSCPSCSSW